MSIRAHLSCETKICTTLKDNGKKDKIMKEARILFYDNKYKHSDY